MELFCCPLQSESLTPSTRLYSKKLRWKEVHLEVRAGCLWAEATSVGNKNPIDFQLFCGSFHRLLISGCLLPKIHRGHEVMLCRKKLKGSEMRLAGSQFSDAFPFGAAGTIAASTGFGREGLNFLGVLSSFHQVLGTFSYIFSDFCSLFSGLKNGQ